MAPADDETTPTPVALPGVPRSSALARRRRRGWPDASVAIVRIVATVAGVCWMAAKGLLAPELAVGTLAVLAAPGVGVAVVGMLRSRAGKHV